MPDKKIYNNIIKWVRGEIQNLSADAQSLVADYNEGALDKDTVIGTLAENATRLCHDFDIILDVTGVKDERNDTQ